MAQRNLGISLAPDYESWTKKPKWSEVEVLYLLAGVDPSFSIQPYVVFDLETSKGWECQPTQHDLNVASKVASNVRARAAAECIQDAIDLGELRTGFGGNRIFRPVDIVNFLNGHGIALPRELRTLVKETKSQRIERLKARVREEKAKGTKAFLQVVAKEEDRSVSRIKQLTSDHSSSRNPWSALRTRQKKGASS